MTANAPIQFKNSAVANKTPQLSDLSLGEIALNTASGKLFLKDGSGNMRVANAKVCSNTANTTREIALTSANALANVWNTVVDSKDNIITISHPLIAGIRWMMISKFSPAGALIWSRTIGPGVGTNTQPIGLAIDRNDSIYVAGNIHNATYTYTATLIKYNSNGFLQWQRQIGTAQMTQFRAVAVDPTTQSIFAAGLYISPSNGSDGLLVKYDTNGNIQYQGALQIAGSTFNDVIGGIVIDKSSNAYLAYYQGTAGSDVGVWSIIKFNTNVGAVWGRKFSNTQVTYVPTQLSLDSNEQPVFAMSNNHGSNNIINIIKLDINGNTLWQRQVTQPGATSLYAYWTQHDANDNVYVSGYGVNASSVWTGNLLKYNSSGVLQWQIKAPRSFQGMAIDSSQNIIAGVMNFQTAQVSNGMITLSQTQSLPYLLNNAYYETGNAVDAAGSITITANTIGAAVGNVYWNGISLTESAASMTDSATTGLSVSVYQ